MAFDKIVLTSSEDALKLAEEGLAMSTPAASQRWRTIRHLLKGEIVAKNTGAPTKFELSPRALLFEDFFDQWGWFGKFGIQPEDYLDVVERARPLVEKVLKGPELKLEKIEGYEQFLAFARERFEIVSQAPRYVGGYDDDPIGQ